MASKEAVKLVEQVINEGRFGDDIIAKAKVTADNDLDKCIENNNIKAVKRLRKEYDIALEWLKDARTKKPLKDGKHYWQLPEWLVFLLAPIPLNFVVVRWMEDKKTRFTQNDLDTIEETLKKARDKANDFIKEKESAQHEAAQILIEALNTLLNE